MSFIAFTVSETVGNSSSSRLHSTCDSLLIAPSLIDDGRLRTPSFQDSLVVSPTAKVPQIEYYMACRWKLPIKSTQVCKICSVLF